MEETLRKKLIAEITAIDERCKQLNVNTMRYKENNDFENAMKSDIKWRQLKMVSQRLKKLT